MELVKINNFFIKLLISALILFPFPALCAENESGAISIYFSENGELNCYLKGYCDYFPYGFKISPDGSLYLANTLKNEILQFDFMGRLSKSYKKDVVMPGDIAFDSEGMIYYANLNDMKVAKLDMLGNAVLAFGGYGTGDSELMSIARIFVAPGKKLFVQDFLQSKINVYNESGNFIRKIDCNVEGFFVNARGELLCFSYDYENGYVLNLFDPNAKNKTCIFKAGLNEISDLKFVGVDFNDNIYVSYCRKNAPEVCEILMFGYNGAVLKTLKLKKSPFKVQFFIFGDGSIYSADIEYDNVKKPSKIAIKKY
ncbi:MAG: hypothetical protein QMC67_00580 [Candidatus Wallbacteria bacterium]